MKTQIFKEQYIPNVHAITLLEPKLDLGKMYPYKTRSYLFVAYNQTQSFGYM